MYLNTTSRALNLVRGIAVLVVAFCIAASAAHATTVSTTLEHAGAAASYGLGHQHHKQPHHHLKNLKARKAQVVKAPTAAPTPNPTSNPTPKQPSSTTSTHVPAITEADDQGCTATNVVAFLQAHDATVLRMVIAPWMVTGDQQAIDCVQAARTAGYKIYLSVRYDAGAPTADTVALFQQVFAAYGPLWAISVGNEESNILDINTVAPTPAEYLKTWNAVEPIIPAGTKAVVGENDGWEISWLEQVIDAHPVDAAAASFHCYVTSDTRYGLSAVPALAAHAATDGLPLWCSEMAPATASGLPGWLQQQTISQYGADVSQTMDESPDVELQSWYEWPQLGAVTPGVDS